MREFVLTLSFTQMTISSMTGLSTGLVSSNQIVTKLVDNVPRILQGLPNSKLYGAFKMKHGPFRHDHPPSTNGENMPEHHSSNGNSCSSHIPNMIQIIPTHQGFGLLSKTLSSHIGTTLQQRYYGSSSFTVYDKHGQPHNDQHSVHEPDWNDIRRDEGSKKPQSDPRLMTYMMVGAAGAVTALSAKSIVFDFLASMSAAADTLALAQTEVDLSGIPEGKNVIITWRGKPVFIRHRTAEEIEEAESVDLSILRDPESDSNRVKKPEWLVMLGICSHLGCVPVGNSGDYNGWYCPCHGSHYDISGRVRKGPAPLNLEIPEYTFISDDKIVIG